MLTDAGPESDDVHAGGCRGRWSGGPPATRCSPWWSLIQLSGAAAPNGIPDVIRAAVRSVTRALLAGWLGAA